VSYGAHRKRVEEVWQSQSPIGRRQGGAPSEARRPLAPKGGSGGGTQEEGLKTLKERRRKIRELHLSREKILARYRDAVPEALEEADGKQRRAVYNTLGVTVWAARTKEDPIRIVVSVLGGREVCHHDRTSIR
jgi:hypothetical protein